MISGAGNPVGGSFTGPAQALEIMGEHAYAYSGLLPSDTSEYTMFNFTSGNYYFVGEVTVAGACDDTSPGVGLTSVFTLSMNGTNLMILKTDTDQEDMPTTAVVPILIPPYTQIKLVALDNGAVGGRDTSASLVGRIYRTRD